MGGRSGRGRPRAGRRACVGSGRRRHRRQRGALHAQEGVRGRGGQGRGNDGECRAGAFSGIRSPAGSSLPKTATTPVLEDFETVFASHPEPDERGVEAARKVQELVESLEEGDLLLALISGGASALLADPAPPIELADLKRLTGDLLRSGADIGEINTVRKHVSVLKGGGLVRLAHPGPDHRPPALRRGRRRSLFHRERPHGTRPVRHSKTPGACSNATR